MYEIRICQFRLYTYQYSIKTLTAKLTSKDYLPAVAGNPIRALLDGVIARQAALVAHWLLVGFIHGVMNTDNMSVAGETIDFGPCAFLDTYDPGAVYSSIDQQGRYAYGNQPRMAQWNLARLAETLVPLLGEDADTGLKQAQEAIDGFPALFEAAYASGLRSKLGFRLSEPDDIDLGQDLLSRMAQGKADFTLTFRGLCQAAADPSGDGVVRSFFTQPEAYDAWAVRWRTRMARDGGAQVAGRLARRSPLHI